MTTFFFRAFLLAALLAAGSASAAPFFKDFAGSYAGTSTFRFQGGQLVPGVTTATFTASKNGADGVLSLTTIYTGPSGDQQQAIEAFTFTRTNNRITISQLAPLTSATVPITGTYKRFVKKQLVKATVPWSFNGVIGSDTMSVQLRKTDSAKTLTVSLVVAIKPSSPRYEVFTWKLTAQ